MLLDDHDRRVGFASIAGAAARERAFFGRRVTRS
jgi:hypothetical protein